MMNENKLLNWSGLAAAYFRLNLRAHMEYRGAFISQAVAMAVNDFVWIVFWTLFFTRFPVLKGWDVKDVLTIWGLAATGYGLAAALCGNAHFLPSLVVRGQLDAWMLYPRRLLPHVILGKMSASAWGDVVFGYAVYIFFVRPDPPHLFLFILLSLTSALTFLGFCILVGSLSFFIGNSEVLAEQARMILVTFSTYPSTLFEGAVKVLLYTLIPAGFVSYLPVEALHRLSWQYTLCTALGALLVLAAGVGAFYLGLRRYESGSLLEMRG
jgi:ABC-2 type transport system permease protein